MELKSCSLPVRGVIADTSCLPWSGGYRNGHCALGTLRRGAPPAQEEEDQAKEKVALNMLSTGTVVTTHWLKAFAFSGHLDY